MEFLSDLIAFLKHQKKWWLIPVLLALLVAGILMISAEGTAVATFIYPLF
ncbi:MAG: DUF5989 family protein [Bacteroidia bacterium]|nr:DUF5989 family protein [Bacteroidia bacterium]MCF8427051.1 DUF5989 family protein [Bacteroidia bacterium]MCF8446465.1 DUF5989 family protein [Bacteroidia bacterium]